jgi:hypothetical protein
MILLRTGHTETSLHDYILEPNYPNPFNASTLISFSGTNTARITIKIFNALGQLLRTWDFPVSEPGRHTVFWDSCDRRGNLLSSGIYFCRIFSDAQSRQIKMLLLR